MEAGICTESAEAKMRDIEENVIDNENNMVKLLKNMSLFNMK